MQFWKTDDGAALVYVTISIVALVGLAGLAIDSGRLFNLRQEVQNAADAAALAGAWQLDGSLSGSQRADAAARNSIVTNNQKFGNTPGAVSIANVQFAATVPASDDSPFVANAPAYNYIEVTTTGVAMNVTVLRALSNLGLPVATTVSATAVARKGRSKCSSTPLAICNPNETASNPGAPFDPTAYIGRQLLSKAQGGSGQWAPGNWGLLDAPGGNQGTTALATMIGGISGLPACISASGVDPKPGAVTAVRNAFNVRFDMYDAPLFNNEKSNPNFPPARNVAKGISPTNSSCNNYAATPRPTAMPRDTTIPTTTSATSRFGNGLWDCAFYWSQNHPTIATPPSGCGAPSSGNMTRYEMYLYEATNGLIPNTTGASPQGDNGAPICYQLPSAIPPTPTAINQRQFDRRILTVAVLDCIQHGVQGNASGNVPVKTYLSTFITEPVGLPPDADLYLEIVGTSDAGGGGIVPVDLHEWVELVR